LGKYYLELFARKSKFIYKTLERNYFDDKLNELTGNIFGSVRNRFLK